MFAAIVLQTRKCLAVAHSSNGAHRTESFVSEAVSSLNKGSGTRPSGTRTIYSSANGDSSKVAVATFWLNFKAEFGQRIRIVGASPALGAWDQNASPELEWSEGHMWHAKISLPRGSVHEYKFVLFAADGVTPVLWQKGNNSVISILVSSTPIHFLMPPSWFPSATICFRMMSAGSFTSPD